MNIFRIILLAAVIMMAPSCKRNAELLDSIPADADAVPWHASISDGSPENAVECTAPTTFPTVSTGLKHAVDLSEVFLVVDAGGAMYGHRYSSSTVTR